MSKNTRRPKQNTTPTPPTSKMKLSSSDRAAIQGLLAQRKLVTEKTAETYDFRIEGAKAKEHELPACTTSVQSKDKSQLVTDKSTLVEAVSSFEEFQTRGVGPVHAEIWRRLASLRERVVNLADEQGRGPRVSPEAASRSSSSNKSSSLVQQVLLGRTGESVVANVEIPILEVFGVKTRRSQIDALSRRTNTLLERAAAQRRRGAPRGDVGHEQNIKSNDASRHDEDGEDGGAKSNITNLGLLRRNIAALRMRMETDQAPGTQRQSQRTRHKTSVELGDGRRDLQAEALAKLYTETAAPHLASLRKRGHKDKDFLRQQLTDGSSKRQTVEEVHWRLRDTENRLDSVHMHLNSEILPALETLEFTVKRNAKKMKKNIDALHQIGLKPVDGLDGFGKGAVPPKNARAPLDVDALRTIEEGCTESPLR